MSRNPDSAQSEWPSRHHLAGSIQPLPCAILHLGHPADREPERTAGRCAHRLQRDEHSRCARFPVGSCRAILTDK